MNVVRGISLLMIAGVLTGCGPTSDNPAVQSGRNDVVYLAPATERYEALSIGNGRLGATVWNENGMSYQLMRGDFYINEPKTVSLASGRVDLRLPADWMPGFTEERLSLYDAAVYTHFKTGSTSHQVKSWMVEGLDALAIEISSDAVLPELTVELSIWGPAEGMPARPASEFAVGTNDIGLTTIGHTRKIASPVMAEAGEAQVVAAKVDDRRLKLTIPSQGRKQCVVFVAAPISQAEAMDAARSFADARAVLAQARAKGAAKLWQVHADYWKDFWSRSSILMHSADGFAGYCENLYYLHLYWLGSSSRGVYPTLFDGANFLLLEDLRSWGGCYWYQNTRQLYWPLLAAGHPELWTPFIDLYVNNLPAARQLARDFECTGAAFEETMSVTGTGDKRGNVYTMLYHTTGTEIAHQFYQYYLYTGDETYLREKVYPVMKEAITYHLNFVSKRDDGKYHVYPSDARETYWWTQDSITDLSALRATLPLLIQTSEKLGLDETERVQWKAVLQDLAPFVRDPAGGTFVPGTFFEAGKFPAHRFAKADALYKPEQRTTLPALKNFNAENVEMEPVYPWGLIDLDSPSAELEAMRRTYGKRRFTGWGGGWEWGAVTGARLGSTDEVVRLLRCYTDTGQEFPSGLARTPGTRPKVWGGKLNAEGGYDGSGVFATALQEMQFQSHGGKFRVYPAWPKGWESEFTLRAPAGFVVSSAIAADGTVPFVRIISERGGSCRLVNPWAGEIVLRKNGKDVPLKAQDMIVLQTQPKDVLLLSPKAPSGAGPRIEVVRNQGPKWSSRTGPDDTAEAYLARRVTPPGSDFLCGFLGIAKDGSSPARIAVREALSKAAKQP